MFLARFGQGGKENMRLVLKERVFGTTQEIEEMWKFHIGCGSGNTFLASPGWRTGGWGGLLVGGRNLQKKVFLRYSPIYFSYNKTSVSLITIKHVTWVSLFGKPSMEAVGFW